MTNGQVITRNLISEIETIEYLLESELEQAKKVINKYISELRALAVCKDDSFVKEH